MKYNYKLFPTLVTKYSKIVDPERREKIKEYILSDFSKDNHPALIGDVDTSFDVNDDFLEQVEKNISECFQIKNFINDLINDYAQELSLHRLRLTNSWYTVQRKGSVLKQHCHPGSIVSGAMYIYTDENSSKLCFNNPIDVDFYFNTRKSINDYNMKHCEFSPESGDIFIFPSWLYHGSNYGQNQTENRIIISFNTEYAE